MAIGGQGRDAEAAPPGVILAGGQGRRMGGADKALCLLGGVPLAVRLRDLLAPQVSALALNAGGDAGRFAALGLPVIADPVPGAGPLSGVLAALDWAAGRGADRVLTAAVDTPFLPGDLAARLCAAGRLPALAEAGGRLHPTAALWPVAARAGVAAALAEGRWKLGLCAEELGAVRVPFADAGAFFNVNTPEDLAAAEARL